MANSACAVQNGGWISSFFNIERGFKQGCCVSPLLFISVVEMKAIKIRNNKNINGLYMSNNKSFVETIKILQYTDDTSLT